MQEEMHLSEAGNKLYHSFRLEQTSILGFLLAVDKLLTPEQFGCLEAFSYPWWDSVMLINASALSAGKAAAAGAGERRGRARSRTECTPVEQTAFSSMTATGNIHAKRTTITTAVTIAA